MTTVEFRGTSLAGQGTNTAVVIDWGKYCHRLVPVQPDAHPAILPHKPLALEGLDTRIIRDEIVKHIHPRALRELPDGGGWLVVQFGGESNDNAEARGTTFGTPSVRPSTVRELRFSQLAAALGGVALVAVARRGLRRRRRRGRG